MAMAGAIGAKLISAPDNAAAFWFGEDQGRYVVTTSHADKVTALAQAAGIAVTKIGATGGTALELADGGSISVAELVRVNESWLPEFMAG